MGKRSLGKNRLKFGEDFTDFAPDIEDVIKHEGSLCASERYRDGDIAVHVHLRIGANVHEGNATEYCARFCKAEGVVKVSLPNDSALGFVEGGKAGPFFRPSIGHKSSGTSCYMQKPVLISVVDPTKPGKRMVESLVTSDVWLTLLDQCDIALEQPPKVLPPTSIPSIVVVGYDKGSLYGYFMSPLDDQGRDYIVQNRSTLMRPLSDKESPFKWRLASQPKDVLSALFIELTPNAASYGIDESADFTVELGEVLICPLEPKSERLDGITHQYSLLYSNHERKEDAKDAQGSRDTHTHPRGLPEEPRPSSQTDQETLTVWTPSEPKLETERDHRRGDCTAKHTRLGSLEDA